jgi:DNA-binding response OmpR family regulator
LLVCPDTDTRGKILQLAGQCGHDVVECISGAEALKLVQMQLFHLVLIDADLGDSNGLSLAQALRHTSTSSFLIALMSTDIPRSISDFSWIKLWMHKPPRESELQFAFSAASSARGQRLQARLRRSLSASQSASA